MPMVPCTCRMKIPMDAIKLLIFDVAGTIVQDRGEVLRAFSTALEKHGVAHTTAELKEWKGSSKQEVIRHFVRRQAGPEVSESAVADVYGDFRRELERHCRDNGVLPIPGRRRLLHGCTNTAFCWRRLPGSIARSRS